ncbi:cytochrome c oxidase assembly protein [Terriglobus albidus]|uniref:cytochrome c oxidase assembly protein n=1 Tax=Terriglobus albidus TaxID=1592106 RepID=UPI0021DF796D|nr:cytochrome c oxidase assembly protein [Terriglobus albidus]
MVETSDLWREWDWAPIPLVSALLSSTLYLRGWASVRQTHPRELPVWRAVCFQLGLLLAWLAVSSPIGAFDDYLLSAHMLQHFILMSAAPPLIVLGAPVVPLLRGVPRPILSGVLRPWMWSGLRKAGRILLHPASVWLLMNGTFLGWHVPVAFERTFSSELLHNLEHAMFLFTSCAFWWVVLAPWPAKRVWPAWTMIPYLLSADVLNTILCALLMFSGRIFYSSYANADRITRLNPLQDQVAAGGEMWVLNSAIFLGFAAFITIDLLAGNRTRIQENRVTARMNAA